MVALDKTPRPKSGPYSDRRFGRWLPWWSRVAALPLKFKENVTVEFHRIGGGRDTLSVNFEAGQVVHYLIVTDFDDFTATLEFRSGWVAYKVPRTLFVAAPNF